MKKRAFKAGFRPTIMNKIIITFLTLAICAVAEPATNYLYRVTVFDWSEKPLMTFTNVTEVVRQHDQGCDLVRYRVNDRTNDFHAWLVPIKVEKQK